MNEVDAEELQKVEQLKKNILKNMLSKQALERLGRIRVVKPQLALQLELYLVQLYQSGKISSEISDMQLKEILDALTEKKQFKIIR
jgi:programmed cell death protein 5